LPSGAHGLQGTPVHVPSAARLVASSLMPSKINPLWRRVLAVVLAASELAGVAETARVLSSRLLNRQLSLPVSTMSQ
jgi:hypothetical protein